MRAECAEAADPGLDEVEIVGAETVLPSPGAPPPPDAAEEVVDTLDVNEDRVSIRVMLISDGSER